MNRTAVFIGILAAVGSVPSLHAADKTAELRTKLADGDQASTLDGSDLSPWHWKLELTFFDADGKNPKAGSLEMWFRNGEMRTVASLGGEQITTLRLGNSLFQTSGDTTTLAPVWRMQMHLLHPIPEQVLQPPFSLKASAFGDGTESAECVGTFIAPIPDPSLIPSQPVSFCFSPGTSSLIFVNFPGGFRLFRSRVGKFQSHELPIELEQIVQGKIVAVAKTVILQKSPVPDSMLQMDAGMTPVTMPVALDTKIAGLVLSEDISEYPHGAAGRTANGKFAFDAIIGKDGHITALQPTGSLLLTAPTKAAVSRWIFQPFRLNGLAVEAKTRITFDYELQ